MGDVGDMDDADLLMLANDIADLFDRYDYPVNADTDTVLAALPAFLTNLGVTL